MASQPCANAGKQTGFLGIIVHRMNSNRSIKSCITTFFSTNHHICLVRTVVITRETLHLQCSYTEALSSKQMTENRPTDDCHGNRAFEKHHHQLVHLMQSRAPSVLENEETSFKRLFKSVKITV